jgi:hypothetical protein
MPFFDRPTMKFCQKCAIERNLTIDSRSYVKDEREVQTHATQGN